MEAPREEEASSWQPPDGTALRQNARIAPYRGMGTALLVELILPVLFAAGTWILATVLVSDSDDRHWLEVGQTPTYDRSLPSLMETGAVSRVETGAAVGASPGPSEVEKKPLPETGFGPWERTARPRLGDVAPPGGLPPPGMPTNVFWAYVRYPDWWVVEGQASELEASSRPPTSDASPAASPTASELELALGASDPRVQQGLPPDSFAIPDAAGPTLSSQLGAWRAAYGDDCCRRTQPRVVTAAVMQALVQAERRYLEYLQIGRLGVGEDALDTEEFFLAAAEGIRRVRPGLRNLEQIDFVLPLEVYLAPDVFEAAFAVRIEERLLHPLRTPVRWPGGSAFARPQTVDPGEPPQVAPVAALRAPTTLLPAIFFFAISFLAWVGVTRATRSPILALAAVAPRWLRSLVWNREPWNLALGAVFAWGMLLFLFLGTNHLLGQVWIWIPDSGLATPAGVTLLASLVALGASLALRQLTARGEERLKEAHAEEGERDSMVRTVLVRETPVTRLEDNRLGFGPMVEAFRRFLDNAQTEPPLVVGIHGEWGSGKSSIMSMVSSELMKTGRFRTVWFNAWRYQNEEQAMAAFLQALARRLSADWGAWKGLRIASLRFRSLGFWGMLLLLAPIAATIAISRSGSEMAALFDGLVKAEATTPLAIFGAFLGIGASIKGIPWLLSFFTPFRLRFEKLFETKDYAARIGFLEEFGREFRLFRRVVGHRKLLVVVDDLDRCSPDHVVDVLKAINLIITSDTGAGKTFFLLGFDPEYVARAVQVHFAKFAAGDPRFAEQYLKKMITLSVRVPRTGPEQIETLMASLDQAGLERALGGPAAGATADGSDGQSPGQNPGQNPGAAPGLRDRLTLALRRVPGWSIRLLAAVAVLWLAVLALPRQLEEPGPGGLSLETAQALGALEREGGLQATELAEVVDLSTVVFLDDAEALAPESTPWWAWVPSGMLLLLAGLWILRHRPIEAEKRYRREERDSADFMQAIRDCRNLLPSNPRDVVRLVNRLRMGYLVQSLSAGEALSEREYLFLGIFFERFPELMPRFAEKPADSWLVAAHSQEEADRQQAKEELGEGLFAQYETAAQLLFGIPGLDQAVGEPKKVRRFADQHHYLGLEST